MTKKNTKKEKAEPKFDLEAALSTVNKYLLPGFKEYIKPVEVTSQKQFDELYNNYKEMN